MRYNLFRDIIVIRKLVI